MSHTLQTLVPVATGIATVLIAILVLRLHAFLALLLAAAVTAGLTRRDILIEHQIAEHGVRWRDAVLYEGEDKVATGGESNGALVFIDPALVLPNIKEDFLLWPVGGGMNSVVLRRIDRLSRYGTPYVAPDIAVGGDDILIGPNAYSNALKLAHRSVPSRIAAAFGDTVGSIGLLIAFASIIGVCLLDSGGADRIVRSALALVGEKGAPVAFTGCGFLLGVPVFFDTVFLLMIPLAKALRLRTGRNYILYVLTVVCGATMAHSLVPPTPGPLLVAEALHVDIGMMMIAGTAVGLVTAAYGMLHAFFVNKLMNVPLRDTPEMPLMDLEQLAARPDHELPPLWLSLSPIVVPVFLIAQQTGLKMFLKTPPTSLAGFAAQIPPWVVSAVNVVGEKNTAVSIGVALGLILLVWQTRQSLAQVRNRVGGALATGGAIILITAAGGAFGDMIQQTGVASIIKQMPALGPSMLLAVAFFVTAAIRTAQGSATVAMITAVGLFAGIELPFHAVWLALAIGCGSKPISWMTDSGFWVICKMSGMTETETLKTLTPMTTIMGLVGLVTVILGAMVLPMK